jgi:uncharacterized protein DUF3455
MTIRQYAVSVVGATALGMVLAACAGPPEDEPVVPVQAALHDEGRDGHCRRAPADIPAALAVPANECLSVEAQGIGVQIYTCTAGAWVAKAPEANLVDRHGRFEGNHFLGPTWQWRDGSKVKGAKVAGAAAPDPVKDIPWLLLSVPSEDGDGRLADVTHIQRLHTAGGPAPAGSCTDGAEVRVPYTADYLFYHLRGADCDR